MSLSKFITNIFLLSLCLFALSAVAEVNVTTSIRPLQLIAQAIIEDRGTVRAVINAQDSAHDFTLTPSDRLNFETADLLLWISPEFEVQIADLFESMRKEKSVITAADLTGVSVISLSANELDPHLWLSSSNALAIAAGLTQELQKLDQENQAEYQKAYTRFESNLNSTRTAIEGLLSNLVTLDYLVFHNAYQYFENEFGLRGGLALVQSAEVQPGMRELLTFRNRVEQFSPSCILLEPDSDVQ
ncbi:MAG: zinc ABC transporter substrate-binding protein, partial [Pseudomonadota bacterium]|nr:zinc ABC transporter substrate-binding protein [Pseudomonadota bacterium]